LQAPHSSRRPSARSSIGGARRRGDARRSSGTVDFYEKDDLSCLKRLRSLIALLSGGKRIQRIRGFERNSEASEESDAVYDLISFDGQKQYDVRHLLASVIDANSIDEYKAGYGKTIGRLMRGSIDAPWALSQINACRSGQKEGIPDGWCHYPTAPIKRHDSSWTESNKLANHIFPGRDRFMVGRDAEESGIIAAREAGQCGQQFCGPEDHVVVGGSFGAGNYAMCGKAYDPRFIIAWADCSLRGDGCRSSVVPCLQSRRARERDKKSSPQEMEETTQHRQKKLRRTNRYSLRRRARPGSTRSFNRTRHEMF